jgi:uncharacterized SAM-binding protein YcdF (DUF218 family)
LAARTNLLALVVLGAVAAALVVAYAAFRVWQQGETDDRREADAIVVLGAAHYEETPSAVFAARLDHAIELYKAGFATYLVTTGGRAPGDVLSEAEAARLYAEKRGVPADAILSEDRGRDTLASLRNVSKVLREKDLRSAVFVSDRLHMLRVLRIAEDLRIESYGSPTTTSPADSRPDRWIASLAHELGGLAIYLFLGR